MTVEPLDLNAVVELRDAVGAEAFDDIVGVYREESSKLLGRLDSAILTWDLMTIARCSHSLESSSATLGARPLASACRALQQWAEAGGVGGFDEVDELARRVRALHAASAEALEQQQTRRV